MRCRRKPCCRHHIRTIELLEDIIATLDDVNVSLDSLDQSVKDLSARVQPQDLQPVVDRVNQVKAEVDAIDPTAPPA
jgi:hypothetical protein